MSINYKQCPGCGSKNTLDIMYGMPTSEAFEKAEAGELKLGGCCVIEGAPEYYCNDCEHEWNREQAIDAAYLSIKGFKASVGGFFGGYYNVDIDLITDQITWGHWGGGKEEETINKTISTATAKEFKDKLKMVNLLNWKAKHIEPGVCDGTQWHVELIRDGRNIKKHGDNKFPEEWDMFCSAISQLTGQKFR